MSGGQNIKFKDERNDPRSSMSSIYESICRITGRIDLSETNKAISRLQNDALWNDLTIRLNREDPSVEILSRTPAERNWLFTYADGSLHKDMPKWGKF
jgi:hypothetical protein